MRKYIFKKFISMMLALVLVAASVSFLGTEAYAKTSYTDVSLGTIVTVKLSSATDTKMYRFTTKVAGRISIDVATTAQGDDYAITTTLKDADGRVVVDPTSGSAYSMPSYTAAAGETFYLIVENSYRGYDTSFKITFGFLDSDSWETENNDTSEKADALSAGFTTYGSISKSSDVDFFKFRLQKAKKVKLVFGPSVIDSESRMWDVDLYNEDGDSLDCFNTASKSSKTVSLKKGLYYIRVAGETGTDESGNVTTATSGDYYLLFSTSALSIKKPKITQVKMYGTESWLYDNYATATVSIKNGGSVDGYTFCISRSSNMKSGTKKKNYDISSSNGVTAKKIRSSVRMGIYPRYYVKVRGYVEDAFGSRIYGKYSKIKSGSLSSREYEKLN